MIDAFQMTTLGGSVGRLPGTMFSVAVTAFMPMMSGLIDEDTLNVLVDEDTGQTFMAETAT